MAAIKQLVYSLLSRDTWTMRGPYCSSCLNEGQHIIRKMEDEGDVIIYLHTDKQPNRMFHLDDLELGNGAIHPFDQQDHPKDAAYLPCTQGKCTANHHLAADKLLGNIFVNLVGCAEYSVPKQPASKSLITASDGGTVLPRNKIEDLAIKQSLRSSEEKRFYPPFFVRSENICRPLNLKDETMNDLRNAANNKAKLTLISKAIESRYPVLAKVLKENSCITCSPCERKLSGVAPFIQHILSSKHLNKVNENGDAFDEGDLRTMKEIIADATGQLKTSAPLTKRRQFPIRGPSQASGTVVPVKNISPKVDRFKSAVGLAPPNLPKTLDKKVTKDGQVPLFNGACDPSEGVAMREVPYFISKGNEELSKYFLAPDFKKLKRACDVNGWKEENCPFCPKDLKFKNNFPGHVLSRQHVTMMMSRGVYPLEEDYCTIIELLAEIRFSADEKRRLSLPFYYGSPEEAQQVNEAKLFTFLEKYRTKMLQHPLGVVEMVLEKEYKRPVRCTFCDTALEGAYRLIHIMSPQHIRKVLQSTRYFTSWDVHNMREMYKKIEQAAEVSRSWSSPTASPFTRVR